MAEINISFNGTIYRLDESVLSDATAELKYHLSNVMNGTGAIINIDGTSFNIDSTKLSTATNDLVAHLGTVSGNGTTIVVGGVEHSVSSAKLSDSIVELNTVLGDLQSNSSFTITYYDSDGTTVLKTENLAYGSMPSYAPTKDGYDFSGWNPALSAVTGEASYIATWKQQVGFAVATWAEISAITTAGTSASYFAIGDTKADTLTYADGTTEEIEWVIVKIRDDGTMVLALNHALAALKPMNSSYKAASNYFSNDLGKYITNTIEPALSEELSAVIRPANVLFANRKLRLPVEANVIGTSTSTGVDYEGLPWFATQSHRIRTRKADGVAVPYWLGTRDGRSGSSSYYYFKRVETDGSIKDSGGGAANGATGEKGVVLLADV